MEGMLSGYPRPFFSAAALGILLGSGLACGRNTSAGGSSGAGSGSAAGTSDATGSGASSGAPTGGSPSGGSPPGPNPSCPETTNNQGEFNTPNTLYYIGDQYPGPTLVALSGDDLIWTWGGAGQVITAPKNGCGIPVQLAQVQDLILDLEATAEAAYWLRTGVLQRVSKGGGEVETFSALPYAGYDGLLVTEDLAYVALPGCAAITRMHLDSLENETITAPEPLEYSTGPTYLYLDNGTLYCSAWQRIFRVVDWERLEVLYSGATELWGFRYLSGLGYFLNKVGSSNMQIWTLDGSTATLRSEFGLEYSSDLLVDEARQRLWFGSGGGLFYYAAGDNSLHTVAVDGGSNYELASDGTYLYWGRGDQWPRSIERVRLDIP